MKEKEHSALGTPFKEKEHWQNLIKSEHRQEARVTS